MVSKGLTLFIILLLVGIAFTSSINANVSKSSLISVNDIEISLEDDDTQIEFEFQRIRDLVHCINLRKIIVNPDAVVDTLEEIFSIIEENEYIRNYLEISLEEDCGCQEDSSSFEWYFPVICTLLFPVFVISVILLMLFSSYQFFWFMEDIVIGLKCFFARP